MQDCHGSHHNPHGPPLQDDTQNYHIIDGYQNGTHTHLEFKRLIETCDPYDLPLSVRIYFEVILLSILYFLIS